MGSKGSYQGHGSVGPRSMRDIRGRNDPTHAGDVFDFLELALDHAARKRAGTGSFREHNGLLMLVRCVFGTDALFHFPRAKCHRCGWKVNLLLSDHKAQESRTNANKSPLRYTGVPRWCPGCGWAGGVFVEEDHRGEHGSAKHLRRVNSRRNPLLQR